MGDVGMAIQRAEDKTAQMQARAGAIDELMASGALDDAVGGKRDDIQSELEADERQQRRRAGGRGRARRRAEQLEDSAANGDAPAAERPQAAEQEQGACAPQYTPSQQAQEQQQPQQETQPAGLPVSDLPGLAGEPRNGDGS